MRLAPLGLYFIQKETEAEKVPELGLHHLTGERQRWDLNPDNWLQNPGS